MFDAVFVAAAADRRKFGNRPHLAAGQFLEHFPAGQLLMAEAIVGGWATAARDIFGSSGIWIHAENLKNRASGCQ